MVLRFVFALLGLALAGAIAWAMSKAPFWASFGAIVADPWGLVTLADLYLGFFACAAIIALAERRAGVALAWIVALFVLGNLVTGLWLALRGLPKLTSLRRHGGG
jgi:hypothetical protein